MQTPATAKYVFGKTVNLDHQAAIARVTEELAKEGFGVLTEIDVKATQRIRADAEERDSHGGKPQNKVRGRLDRVLAAPMRRRQINGVTP